MTEPTDQGEPPTEPVVEVDPAEPHANETNHWRSLLSGEDPSMRRLRGMWRRVPHGPRCKVCSAPFAGVGGLATRVILHGRAIANPTMCTTCFKALASHPGGTELDISVLFADVRGSTGMAERSSASEFSSVLARFYELVTRAVRDEGGIIDKFLGDGVMALFIPSFTEKRHAEHGLVAARRILREAELPIGIGLNTGLAFTGFLGPTDEVAGS